MKPPLPVTRHAGARVAFGAVLLAGSVLAAERGATLVWAVLAVTGALAAATRMRVAVDARRQRLVVRWTLLGLPVLAVDRLPLRGLEAVVIERRVRRGSKGRDVETFPVTVRGEGALEAWAPGSLLEGRLLGERLARALRVPLRDLAAGRPRVRAPEELDLSLGERLRAGGAPPERAPLPAGSGIALVAAAAARTATIALPPQPVPGAWALFALAIPAALIALAWGVLPPTGAAVFSVIPALVLAGFAAAIAAKARTVHLVVGPDAVETRGHFSRRRIPFDRLEEVALDGPDLHLLSDEVHAVVPWDFDHDEARFVTSVVERAAWRHAGGALTAEASEVAAPAPPAQSDRGRRRTAPRARRARDDRARPARLRSLAAVLLLVGGAQLALGAWLWRETAAFVARASVADGRVVELARVKGKRSALSCAIVAYRTADGVERRLRDGYCSSSPPYAVGQPVKVLYEPAGGDARIRSRFVLWLGPLVLLPLGAGFVVAAAVAASAAAHRSRALRDAARRPGT